MRVHVRRVRRDGLVQRAECVLEELRVAPASALPALSPELSTDVATVVVCTGGGGLVSGIAAAVRSRRPDVRVVGVVTDARDVLDVTSFLATSWTFGFLQALGVLTGLICAGGLLLYLETRQRSRRAVTSGNVGRVTSPSSTARSMANRYRPP